MVVQSVNQSYELVLPMEDRGTALHGLWRIVDQEDSQPVHLVQIPGEKLQRQIMPYIQELSQISDFLESFLYEDSLFLVFRWKQGSPLAQFLDSHSLTLEQRFSLGRNILEQILVKGIPGCLLAQELAPEEILVDEGGEVSFFYGLPDVAGIAEDGKANAAGVAALLELLFAPWLAGGLYPELSEARDQLAGMWEQPFLELYQRYLLLAGVVTQERVLPEKKKKEPFLPKLKKKAGFFIKVFKIAAGLTVIAAAAVMLLGTWREKVYPVVEAAYLTKTFVSGDEAISAYSGKVEIYSQAGGPLCYSGKLEAGRKTGYGREYYLTGAPRYEGNFLGDTYDGAGRLYSQSGQLLYEGGFVAGEYEGNGTLYDGSGSLFYQGSFVKGQPNGSGILYDKQGRKQYEGDLDLGMYDGNGSLFKDGVLIYEGGFSKGKPDGEGISYENGKVKEKGSFEKGSFVAGMGFLYDKDGNMTYEGSIQAGRPDGEGIAYQDGVMIYEGSFLRGQYEGEGKLYSFENGCLIYQGRFARGSYDGTGILYRSGSGTPVYSGSFRQGFYDGDGLKYDCSGNLTYEGKFLMGNYNGYGTLYDPQTGIVVMEGEFRNGILVTPKEELFPEKKESGETGETETETEAEKNHEVMPETRSVQEGPVVVPKEKETEGGPGYGREEDSVVAAPEG